MKIVLVIFLGTPEFLHRLDQRDDSPTEARLRRRERRARDGELLLAVAEDGRAVLRPGIGPLPVQLRWVVALPEGGEQLAVVNGFRVEFDPHHLGVAGAFAEAAIRSENSLDLLNISQAVIMNLLMGGAMAFTVWQWSKGALTTGDLVLVNTYLIQLFRPLDMLGMVYRTVRQGLIDMAESTAGGVMTCARIGRPL